MDARLILPLLLWAASAAAAFDHAHPTWDALLKKHVVLLDDGKASRLRYADFARDRLALKEYLEGLSQVGESEFNAWSRAEQIAFLINAYNAFTVEKVLTRYPAIGSIWDFGKLFGNPPATASSCCSGSREASMTSSTASCARPIASRASISR